MKVYYLYEAFSGEVFVLGVSIGMPLQSLGDPCSERYALVEGTKEELTSLLYATLICSFVALVLRPRILKQSAYDSCGNMKQSWGRVREFVRCYRRRVGIYGREKEHYID